MKRHADCLLPHGWVTAVSRSRHTEYYFNELTGESLWHDATLPPLWGWAAVGEGRVYKNIATGEAQQAPPNAAAAEGGADGGGGGARDDHPTAVRPSDTLSLPAVVDYLKRAHVGFPVERPGVREYPHGWFYHAHQVVLKELLGPSTRVVIELGTWLGRSTAFIADAAPNAVIFAVDLWDNDFVAAQQGPLLRV